MRTLGIVGFGNFGRFLCRYLPRYFEVAVCDREPYAEAARALGVEWAPLDEVARRDVVVLAVPVQDLGDVLRDVAPMLRPGTLLLDVASVKVRPLELLAATIDPAVDVVGTHPMFGPQSGRDGIAGLKIVLCPLRCRHLRSLRRFLGWDLELEVYEMTPEKHDREMAYIQGLTHWVAKALRELRVPDLDLATVAYRHLLEIEAILGDDSWELFVTIERENPFAAEARRLLMEKLRELDRKVGGGEPRAEDAADAT
jgi:prephenate dehydrogenase